MSEFLQNDINFAHFGENLKNPQTTLFKKNSNKYTHFAKNMKEFKVEIDKDNSHNFVIPTDQYEYINAISNSLLVFKFNSNFDLESIFKQIIEIKFSIGETILLDISGSNLLIALKLFFDKFKKIKKKFNSDKSLLIPILNLIFDNNPLMLSRFDSDLLIKIRFENNILVESKFIIEYFCLTKEEKNMNKNCANMINLNGYLFNDYEIINSNEVFFDCPNKYPIEQIFIYSKEEMEVNLIYHNMKFLFLNSKSEFSYLYKNINIDDEKFLYYLDSAPSFYNACIDDYAGLFYPDEKCKIHIIFSKKISETINIIYKFRNKAITQENKLCLPKFDNCNFSNNYYPLTKIDNNKFIEGYWFEIDVFHTKLNQYPKPKATDNKIDPLFLSKFEKMIKQNQDKNLISYYGNSKCRICGIENGNEEYKFKKNNIEFIIPEGLLHYYSDHNVHPSEEFYNFVLNY
ncbi:Hypothetical protein KVN_LOCUS36 [uncultured virus]|nr:Hypothetical protein KVN_LOCUS36 [uncultured virus]